MNTRRTPQPIRSIAALVIAGALAITACGSDDAPADSPASEEVSIGDPWSRQPAEGQDRSAVYGVITNDSDDSIVAVAASTDVSERVELHQTSMDDAGVMSMTEKEGGYTIGAGESFAFEPGGPHIMLFDIDAATYPESVAVTLEFDDGSSVDFTAEVRSIGDDMEMDDDMEEMDG